MSRISRSLWWWLLLALAVGAGGWMLLVRQPSPGVPAPGRPISTPVAPREEITDADRQRLRDILERRGSTE